MTAVSVASITSDRTSGSPSAYRIDTDFGAENVRSKPGTRFLNVRTWSPFGVNPVPGASPASTARRLSPSTESSSPSAVDAAPIQRPRVSPAPE